MKFFVKVLPFVVGFASYWFGGWVAVLSVVVGWTMGFFNGTKDGSLRAMAAACIAFRNNGASWQRVKLFLDELRKANKTKEVDEMVRAIKGIKKQ